MLPRRKGTQDAGDGSEGDDSNLDAGLKGRFPVKGGPHTVSVAFLKKPGLVEDPRQPFKADYNKRALAAAFQYRWSVRIMKRGRVIRPVGGGSFSAAQ